MTDGSQERGVLSNLLALILGFWGSDNATYDLDGSGLIDGADLTIILADWGECAG